MARHLLNRTTKCAVLYFEAVVQDTSLVSSFHNPPPMDHPFRPYPTLHVRSSQAMVINHYPSIYGNSYLRTRGLAGSELAMAYDKEKITCIIY